MTKIRDKFYGDFSGGINRSKSPFLLKDNELQRGRNFIIDEAGRLKKRRGSQQFGQTFNGIIQLHSDNNGFFAADAGATTGVFRLSSSTNSAAIVTSDTSIAKDSTDFNAGPSTIEIEGDVINYAAGGGGASFTTVTNITSAHAARRSINQWRSIGTLTGSDSDEGVWFTYLNGLTVILCYSGSASTLFTWDGTTLNAITAGSGESDPPSPSRLLETFRDRVFCVNNNTVYYSNLGDPTSWPATVANNSFDIEDQFGQTITAIKQYRRNFIISKPSTMYAYSGSLPVRQLSNAWGVFNENCLQEIKGLLYGYGPAGVFVTNGISFIDIGEPIKDYIQNAFQPTLYSSTDINRVKTAQFQDKFLIYVDDVTEPDTDRTLSNCMFVYNIKKKSWEIWDGWTAIYALKYLPNFRAGNASRRQDRGALFYANNTGSIYRAFENRFTETTSVNTGARQGNDVFSDNFTNTGSNIVFEVLTKPFDLGLPQYEKQFGFLKVFSENPMNTQVSAIIDGGDPIPLGTLSKKIERLPFPARARGVRCALVFQESSSSQSLVLNSCIFEECTTLSQNAK